MLPPTCHVSILQALYIALSMIATRAFDQVRQPSGPIMCREHCRQFTGCTFCVFLVKRLVCIATWSHYLETHGEETAHLDMNKDGDGTCFPREMQCPGKYSRILRTRRSIKLCMKLRSHEMTRLLVAPIYNKETLPFIKMHLQNDTTEQHPFLQGRYVVDIAYVPSTHRVLVVLKLKKYIQSCSLIKNDCVIVRRKILAKYIEVDGALNLVFIAVISPTESVAKMTPDGRHFKDIRKLGYPNALCLDTMHRRLYVGYSKNITSYSYDGEIKEVIRIRMYPYALGVDENVLFVGFVWSVKQIPLSAGSGSKAYTPIQNTPRNILSHGETLYISYGQGMPNIISVVHHRRIVTRTMKPDNRQGNVIALIP